MPKIRMAGIGTVEYDDGVIGGSKGHRTMPDLKTMSRKELMKLRADVDKAISAAGERDRRNALKAAEEAVREHGLTLAEIAPLVAAEPRTRMGAKAEISVRYRNLDDPEQTWSGRGRRPRWIYRAEAAGRSIDELWVG